MCATGRWREWELREADLVLGLDVELDFLAGEGADSGVRGLAGCGEGGREGGGGRT